GTPIAEDPAWKSYVLGTRTAGVTPVRVTSTSGNVTNARGLVEPSKGPTTLTYAARGAPPLVVLDYGREVGGLPFFTANARPPGVERRPRATGPHDVLQLRFRRQGVGLHQGLGPALRGQPGGQRIDLRPHP